MKITKYGHCCLLIEEDGKRILTDPGFYTTQQNEIKNIDILIISHEHGDHYHVESVKKIIENNPQVKIVTNSSVGKLLDAEGIAYMVVENGLSTDLGITIEGFSSRHAEIYKELGQVLNTAYFIGPRLFYPGDAYTNPQKPVDILAIPIAGPWCKLSDTLRYAIEVKPKMCFPVHDGGLKQPNSRHGHIINAFKDEDIQFIPIENDTAVEL